MQLSGLRGDDDGGRRAFVSEDFIKTVADEGDVVLCDAEGRCGHANLGDEVADFSGGERHEFVHFVLGGLAGVGREVRRAGHAAAKEGSEVGVKVGKEHARVGC